MAGPLVVLVGAPGSGKTTVGLALAERLGVTFRDTDADIEESVGKPIADQFVDEGEPVFREREEAAVATALTTHDGVLSLGGGAVLSEPTRRLLADVPVVWLQVSSGAAASRVGMGVSRPVLMGNVRGRLVALLAERTPLYREVSDHVVDTDALAVEASVADIEDWLNVRNHA